MHSSSRWVAVPLAIAAIGVGTLTAHAGGYDPATPQITSDISCSSGSTVYSIDAAVVDIVVGDQAHLGVTLIDTGINGSQYIIGSQGNPTPVPTSSSSYDVWNEATASERNDDSLELTVWVDEGNWVNNGSATAQYPRDYSGTACPPPTDPPTAAPTPAPTAPPTDSATPPPQSAGTSHAVPPTGPTGASTTVTQPGTGNAATPAPSSAAQQVVTATPLPSDSPLPALDGSPLVAHTSPPSSPSGGGVAWWLFALVAIALGVSAGTVRVLQRRRLT